MSSRLCCSRRGQPRAARGRSREANPARAVHGTVGTEGGGVRYAVREGSTGRWEQVQRASRVRTAISYVRLWNDERNVRYIFASIVIMLATAFT